MAILNKSRNGSAVIWNNGVFKLNFRDYAKIINNAYERAVREDPSKKHDLIEFVPNAFFVPQVRFKGEGRFESLSSGEQQYYNAINTIVYHILNLDSISNHYTRVNILFDEVELYFHPEFQRTFISDLLQSLNNLKLDKIKEVNILFSTHSPFILSDIPSSNILRLIDGVPQDQSNETFAANIYDLLNDDFFLKDGVIGEFAKQKIKIILSKNVISEEDIKVLELIGDPLLKSVVINQANAKINDDDLINRQIEKLKEKLKNK
jgi:predicted ATP-binding protein involved in virulence